MILRRIAAAVRRQDWFTVGVEIMIVVLGVFIGIQVANWNDARIDEGRAAAYLERISLDLDARHPRQPGLSQDHRYAHAAPGARSTGR